MKLKKEQIEAVLVDGPKTLDQLSKDLNCCPATVCKSMKAYGLVQSRKPYTRSRVRECGKLIKIIADFIKNDPIENLMVLANKHNTSREYISQIEAQLRSEGVIK